MDSTPKAVFLPEGILCRKCYFCVLCSFSFEFELFLISIRTRVAPKKVQDLYWDKKIGKKYISPEIHEDNKKILVLINTLTGNSNSLHQQMHL